MSTVLTSEQLDELERMEAELGEMIAQFEAMLARIARLREKDGDDA